MTLHSTLLNAMDSEVGSTTDMEDALADSVAAGYPGRLVVFFRSGAGGPDVPDAFFSVGHNYIAMPGFDVGICSGHDWGTLAHEIGHYLGLEHTFAETFETVDEAAGYFRRFGSVPGVFDGDHLDDTPPDPYVESIVCGSEPVLVLDGVTFALPRENVMSYWRDRTGLSVQQTAVARWVAVLRQENGMAIPMNEDALFCVEAEALEILRAEGGFAEEEDMRSFDASEWNASDQLTVHADAGAELDLVFHVSRTGRYQVDLYLAYGPDYGRIQMGLDGREVGETFDAYGPLRMTSGAIDLGEMMLSIGEHTPRFVVTGMNADSAGYSFGIDCLSLVPLD